jgi:hypothetical protein
VRGRSRGGDHRLGNLGGSNRAVFGWHQRREQRQQGGEGASESSGPDDVVDAEFEEVNEDGKKA